MKTILLSSFLFFSFLSFSQTREEIISRHENGMKKTVLTYSGTGNTEKIVKVTEYKSYYLVPLSVRTYGLKNDSQGRGEWDVIKVEYFKNGGATEDHVDIY
jgi:hypothetical protein